VIWNWQPWMLLLVLSPGGQAGRLLAR